MGDMKTPDFDDLLAAFDIPDPTSLDAKEAIQTPSEEREGPLKPAGLCADDSAALSHAGAAPDAPAVSVIVKNTSRQESLEAEKDHMAPSLLPNGFRGPAPPPEPHHGGKFDSPFVNGDSARSFPGKLELPKSEPLPTFSQFSPISSPEPEDPIKEHGFVIKSKHTADSYFPPPPGCGAVGGPVLEALAKFPVPELHMFDHFCKREPKPEPLPLDGQQEPGQGVQKAAEPHKELASGQFLGEALGFGGPSSIEGPPARRAPALSACASAPPRQRLKPAHSKLSSCVAALVALQAKRVAGVAREDHPGHAQDPPGPAREAPKVPKSPKSPRSPLEATRKSVKPLDSPRSASPRSTCSDSSSRGSPPAIPKVRIKTIKTSSGEIKRTVTRVLPDPDDLSKSPAGSPVGGAPAEASSKVPGDEGLPQPVEGPPEAGTSSGNPRGDSEGDESSGPRVPKGAVPGPQAGKTQQSTALQPTAPAPAHLLPKAVHLANLNLVPHSVAASVTAKSSAQGRGQPQPPHMSVPLVHQVRKAAPLIVEVFNKVLHSSNPVPLYAPNLSPPADSRIHVPASGYCCLECGDAFALEKSLGLHYARRSVHIEVLCTLCAKTLLFFNKCSLLRHARDHKGRGLVMQCSQLLVKPIAADQMFVPAPLNTATAPASPKPGSSSGGAAPPVPALPLYPDPVRLIRYGTKCPECHKQMRDYMVLATHFQRVASETEGLTCQVCQMLLPNQCSFCAHQRVHAHKSPYCCPECGVLCRSAYFQTHVKENCLHYARKVHPLWGCPPDLGLAEEPHPGATLPGLPQVCVLPHGLQDGQQHCGPQRRPAPGPAPQALPAHLQVLLRDDLQQEEAHSAALLPEHQRHADQCVQVPRVPAAVPAEAGAGAARQGHPRCSPECGGAVQPAVRGGRVLRPPRPAAPCRAPGPQRGRARQRPALQPLGPAGRPPQGRREAPAEGLGVDLPGVPGVGSGPRELRVPHEEEPRADAAAAPVPAVRAVLPHAQQPAQAHPQQPRHREEGLHLRVLCGGQPQLPAALAPAEPRQPYARHPKPRFEPHVQSHTARQPLPTGKPAEKSGRRRRCPRHQQRHHRVFHQKAQVAFPVCKMWLCHGLGARVSEPRTSAPRGQLHGPVPPVRPVLHVHQLPQPPPLHRPQSEGPGGGGGGGRGGGGGGGEGEGGGCRSTGRLWGGGGHGNKGEWTRSLCDRALAGCPRGSEVTGHSPDRGWRPRCPEPAAGFSGPGRPRAVPSGVTCGWACVVRLVRGPSPALEGVATVRGAGPT
ncbi:zinc finger protein 592 isoform X1 [Dipodomys merriami]|uniref:zinc finger protein 592 isoform X1 n=1 Tax=Dipodomys merriami TaxID=94247 RepID=UPI0038560568